MIASGLLFLETCQAQEMKVLLVGGQDEAKSERVEAFIQKQFPQLWVMFYSLMPPRPVLRVILVFEQECLLDLQSDANQAQDIGSKC